MNIFFLTIIDNVTRQNNDFPPESPYILWRIGQFCCLRFINLEICIIFFILGEYK